MSDPNLTYWINQIAIKDSKAYLPFDLDELRWLAELIPSSDGYKDIVMAVIEKMEASEAEGKSRD